MDLPKSYEQHLFRLMSYVSATQKVLPLQTIYSFPALDKGLSSQFFSSRDVWQSNQQQRTIFIVARNKGPSEFIGQKDPVPEFF